MLDCGLDIAQILKFLPLSVAPNKSDNTIKKWTHSDKEKDKILGDELREVAGSVFVDGSPEFCSPELGMTTLSEVDAILLSNHNTMLALPYITEYSGFKGTIYCTEPTLQIGRQYMEELVTYVERNPRNKKCSKWKSDGILASLPAPLRDAIRPTAWRECYTRHDIQACLSKVQTVGYNEKRNIFGALTITACSSGYSIGSCNWTIKSPYQKICYISGTSTLTTHPKPMDTDPLRQSDLIILSSMTKTPGYNPDQMIGEFCVNTVVTIKNGGNVLVPCYPSGMTFDLFECLSGHLDSCGLTTVPLYFLSPVSDSSLAYSNIYAEWLSTSKQSKVYLPEPPFPHAELVSIGRLRHYTNIHDGLQNDFKSPCIVFAGHPSLRMGDVVHFMELWGKSSSNTILFTEPDFPYIEALAPFQPLQMKVCYCPIDTSLNFSQANKLMRDLKPGHLVVSESYVHPPANLTHKTDLVIDYDPQPLTYKRGEILTLPIKRQFETVEITPQLAKNIGPVEVKPGCMVSMVTAALNIKDNKYTLEMLPEGHLSGKKRRADGSLIRQKSYIWGSLNVQTFVDALTRQGITDIKVEDTEDGSIIDLVKMEKLQAQVLIDFIESEKGFYSDQSLDKDRDKKMQVVQEQLAKITIQLPDSEQEEVRTSITHLLILADISMSMSGSPLAQVKDALTEILGNALQHSNIITDLFLFNNMAFTVDFDRSNYLHKIEEIKASGGTCFSKAFSHLGAEMKRIEEKAEKEIDRSVIVFLTDGMDSSLYGTNQVQEEWFQTLMGSLKEVTSPYTIHTVGFSKEHHYNFLKKLTEQGSGEGLFRYCEPKDGPTVLRDKLQELFDFVLSNATAPMKVNVSIPGTNQILEGGTTKNTATYLGEITTDETSGKRELGLDLWIFVCDPNTTDLTINVEMTVLENEQVEKVLVPCEVTMTTRQVIDAQEKVMWNVKVLQRNCDVLSAAIGKAINDGNVKDNMTSRVDKLQERVSRVPLFKREFDKEIREGMKVHLDDIKTKINHMRTVLAEYARGNTQSVQMLARAHDMRYQAKFSKSRRQRILDKRVAKNMPNLQTAQSQLDQLILNHQEIEQMSSSAKEFFVCSLSLNNIRDVLLDSDKDDAIGFGLAVRRQEHVLDAPTLVELHSISGTLVSRSAMLDALEYKINCSGQLKAHGGFDFTQPLGVTTVGQSREPINAWLPLYCTRQHWERVKVLLKPSLGYFCTLDPLGYDFQQMDVMFMVLGSMVGGLTDTKSSDQQLKMIFCFLQTCQACIQEFSLENRLTEAVNKFLTSPEDRMKHKLPNLYTMIGYVLSLPADTIRTVIECTRRGASRILREINSNITHGLVDLILHGNKDKDVVDEKTAYKDLVKCLYSEINNKKDLPLTKVFDPREGLTIDDSMTKKYDEKMDQTMEVWAQAELDIIRNKNQTKKVNAARKAVEQWQQEGRAAVVVDPVTESGCGVDDPCVLTNSKLQHLTKMIKTFSSQSKPSLSSFLGCMAFIEFWLLQSKDLSEMDLNDGLPPEGWIEMAKEAVKKVYTCANEQVKCFMTESEDEDLLVVKETVSSETASVPGGSVSDSQCTTKRDDDVDDFSDDNDNGTESDYDIEEDFDVSPKPRKVENMVHKHISLPVILTLIDPDLDVVQLSRLLMCQVIAYHSNSKARAAVANNQYINFATKVDYQEEIRKLDAELIKMREEAIKDVMESVQNLRANYCMLHTPSMWAFIGYLMCTYKERNQGFSDLLSTIVDENSPDQFPLLADKVRVMFLGKYKDYAVLARGNVWIPEAKVAKQFAKVLGEEVWNDIDVEVRSHVKLHVYRESDIPNRHGHCNSNPYIPNALRRKLGMPLLKN
ncbi:uncharacterized protein LOC133173822 [Saccostrea echinata]|uniref:uncharacterized protein LOC133173822 n=1 Tax=Saccostrea echinata TaxID=191078 RepID=UPI002A818280|nr:uncharacterized protein LOC133173822 [Saccostrea echinata]